MTPPALARMSGTTITPLSNSAASAAGVTGWLAASMSSFSWGESRSTLRCVTTSPSAAGTRTSHVELEQLARC